MPCFRHLYFSLLTKKIKKKGGDPAAPSRTATLLRLNTHRRRYPPLLAEGSNTADFVCLTGGVCKRQERIHRGVADPRLLPIPRS